LTTASKAEGLRANLDPHYRIAAALRAEEVRCLPSLSVRFWSKNPAAPPCSAPSAHNLIEIRTGALWSLSFQMLAW